MKSEERVENIACSGKAEVKLEENASSWRSLLSNLELLVGKNPLTRVKGPVCHPGRHSFPGFCRYRVIDQLEKEDEQLAGLRPDCRWPRLKLPTLIPRWKY